MKIAIPVAEGNLAMHFGHCQTFAILTVNIDKGEIVSSESLVPPAHAPGVLPKWLGDMGANVIIAGGMGQRAISLFTENSIEVVIGAPVDTPENLVKSYIGGTLVSGQNVCDH